MNVKKMIAMSLALLICFGVSACNGVTSQTDSNGSQSSENSISDSAMDETSENINTSSSSEETDNTPSKEEITYETYGSYWFPQHDPYTMPVSAYNSCPPQEGKYTQNFMLSEDLFRMYSEAGVNTMMGLTDFVTAHSSSVEAALDYCYDYNLAYLLAYASAWKVSSESSIRSALARVMYHDNFAGIMLSDEPGRVMFEDMAKSAGLFENVLKDVSPKLYHANLFPTYANQKQLWFRSYTSSDVVPDETYDYEQYVQDYLDIYQPPVLSYDHYPIRGQFPCLANGYFENMSIIRKAALERNIPFWTYIQTCSFAKGQRLPTEADLLWNVNTCLAYGAKGIQYFCGVVPNDGGEIFNGAMFDHTGAPTEVYYHVQKADKQLAAIDEVLMCSKSRGLIVAGVMPQLNDGSENRMSIPQEDILVNYGKLFSVDSEHAMIGCFDYNGKTALYVVNNAIADDTETGATAATTATLRFDGAVKGYYVKEAVKGNFTGESLLLEFVPGEGVLVVIEE